MSFDTKYRPLLFKDVVGQPGTTRILKTLLKDGDVFQKSYIFAGPSGTGKTTTARILARAMLCDNVSDQGEPCNQCVTCREIIEGRQSFDFVEMDAANNSGVDTIRSIIESADYYTLGGKERKIYLIDESHRLSTSAMDALLKPMEDNVPGSSDKRLVCLFCTTEPEKLRDTIKARCMLFNIREPQRKDIVQRLKFICEQEGLTYEDEALDMIYASGRGHIRDMVTALERVSRMGDVTLVNTRDQLGYKTQELYYKALLSLRKDLPKALQYVREAAQSVGPLQAYRGLAETALISYRVGLHMEENIPSVDLHLAKEVYITLGDALLLLSDRILTSDKRMDDALLVCEIAMLHKLVSTGTLPSVPSWEHETPTQEISEPTLEEPTSPNLKLTNEILSRDPSYRDIYGDNGSQFVRQGKRIEVVAEEEEEVGGDPVPTRKPQALRRVTSGTIAEVRGLFDD